MDKNSQDLPNTALTGLPLCGVRDVHPIPEEHRGHSGGTAAHLHCNKHSVAQVSLHAHAPRAVRHFAWLEVGSVKAALSRPGRAPGWYPILGEHRDGAQSCLPALIRVLTQYPAEPCGA